MRVREFLLVFCSVALGAWLGLGFPEPPTSEDIPPVQSEELAIEVPAEPEPTRAPTATSKENTDGRAQSHRVRVLSVEEMNDSLSPDQQAAVAGFVRTPPRDWVVLEQRDSEEGVRASTSRRLKRISAAVVKDDPTEPEQAAVAGYVSRRVGEGRVLLEDDIHISNQVPTSSPPTSASE